MKKFLLMLVGVALVSGASAGEYRVSESGLQIDIWPSFICKDVAKDFGDYKNFFVLTKSAFNEWKANSGMRFSLADASWAFGEAKQIGKRNLRLRYINSAADYGSFGKLPIDGKDVLLPADPEGNTKYILVMAGATDYYSLQLRTQYYSGGSWVLDTAVGGSIDTSTVLPEAFETAIFTDYTGKLVGDKRLATFVFEVTGEGEVSVGGVCDEDGNIICPADSGYTLTIPAKIKDGSGAEYTVTSFREKLYFDGTTDGAFSTCYIKKMYIPATIESLGACAFKGCSELVYLNFASKVPPSIGANVFVGTQLKNGVGAIDVPFGYGPTYTSAEGWTDPTNKPYLIHLHDYNSPAIFYFDAEGNLVDSAAEATLAFTQTSLTEVKVSAANGDISGEIVIPEKIVGSDGVEYTVAALSRKQNDHIGGNLTGAFSWCANITKVVLPATIETIPDSTFLNCTALTEMEIPESVKTIETKAFYNCQSIKTMEMKSETPPTLGKNALYNCKGLEEIIVPLASVEAYKSAPGWSAVAPLIKTVQVAVKSIACAAGKVTVGFEATEGYFYKLIRSGDLSFATTETVDEVFNDGTVEGTTLVDEEATAPTAFYKVELAIPSQTVQE